MTSATALPPVMWWAPLLNPSGYADEARGFIRQLVTSRARVGVRVLGDVRPGFAEELDPQIRSALGAAVANGDPAGSILVMHLPAHALSTPARHPVRVARTMFETDRLPPTWVEQLNRMDEVWVPSSFNVGTFRAAGVQVPVQRIPSGVDTDRFTPAGEALALPGVRRTGTVFLSVFEWSFRKGWDVLLRAWVKAFSPRDDVRLVLRTYAMDGATPAQLERRVDDYLRKLGTARSRVAPIVLLHDRIRDVDMPDLYRAADCFVLPTRGEGWGRPFLEAMATGLPVIATRWSAHQDFLDDDNSRPVEIDGLESGDGRSDLPQYEGHLWAKPSTRSLVEQLRWVAGHPDEARALGARARADVVANWSWDAVTPLLLDRLCALGERLPPAVRPSPSSVPVRWHGQFFGYHSLAHVNRELGRHLIEAGGVELVAVTDEEPEPALYRDPALSGLVAAAARELTRPTAVELRHHWPPNWAPAPDAALVVVQPWEFGGIPDDWITGMLTSGAEVWAYSSFVRDCYVASGAPFDRVHVVPAGVDTALFTPDGPVRPLRTRKKVKLLYVGGLIGRKGADVLLEAYTRAFGPGDDVCLVVKSFGGATWYRGQSMDEQVRVLAESPATAEIELIEDDLTPAGMAALYRACDVLVLPYRGEGFGLPIAEAMASGLPAVVPDAGASTDFCDEHTAFLLPAAVTQVVASVPSRLGAFLNMPDALELATLLRRVVADGPELRRRGDAACRRIRTGFSWELAAHRAQERLSVRGVDGPMPPAPTTGAPILLDAKPGTVLLHHPVWAEPVADDVIEQYAREFSARDDVTLAVLLDPAQGVDQDAVVARIIAAMERGAGDSGDAPDILLVPDVLGPWNLPDLYHAVDAAVRAAGCLPPVGAAARTLGVVTRSALAAPADGRPVVPVG